jgi:hypothetical protein
MARILSNEKGLYADKPWHSIRWDSDSQCVFAEWNGFATSVEFRECLMNGLQAIKDHRAVRYVSDTRGAKLILDKDRTWVNETWVPLAAAAGLRRLALVVSTQPRMARLAVEAVAEAFDSDRLQLHTFESLDEAMRWVAHT